MPEDSTLNRQNIVACIWDFDKTLIPGYMQWPIFEHYGIDEKRFWKEVNDLPQKYKEQGQIVSTEIMYLNHILTYIRHGKLAGLNNALLRKLGAKLNFYQGLPEFFQTLKDIVTKDPMYARYEIRLEHYIISTGLAEMIRGSAIAPYVEQVYGCELIENPLPPNFASQPEFEISGPREVSQIGHLVDNTIKTRYVFEINKGTNKITSIDVNSRIAPEDRRVPVRNMIYVADGPSDVPVFSVVRKHGGKAYAVYEPKNEKEFAQNDALRASERVDHFGRADYREKSDTYMWLTTHVRQICNRIVEESERALTHRVGRPPQHLHRDDPPVMKGSFQENLFEDEQTQPEENSSK
ncbi:haloacid dehalogenase-like hydrolase [Oceanipulchritudo coccoides]|uniref:haloacid dehalogenase-like hydrolase n=1 Tax=Oceanipulchritudo coccoides TaxID=2706888 RepID=UPI001EE825F5|nr:haloacid dehalogenase-like hydrolase [Oceanipulchritudo coccoides]